MICVATAARVKAYWCYHYIIKLDIVLFCAEVMIDFQSL